MSATTDTERRVALIGAEVDAHSRFRHYLVWRRGERAAVKRHTNRRERRERKLDARRRVWEEA